MAMGVVYPHSLTMLLGVAIVGGLTLMMGQHERAESLFYYFRLEDQVPEDHLLRLVDAVAREGEVGTGDEMSVISREPNGRDYSTCKLVIQSSG